MYFMSRAVNTVRATVSKFLLSAPDSRSTRATLQAGCIVAVGSVVILFALDQIFLFIINLLVGISLILMGVGDLLYVNNNTYAAILRVTGLIGVWGCFAAVLVALARI